MRSLLYLCTALAVIALAAWAYRENHLTQQAINERRSLERSLAALDEAISIQRAEWAYLNRPDRLRDLVDVNFAELKLIPITGQHFGDIGQIVYPLPIPRAQTEAVLPGGSAAPAVPVALTLEAEEPL